VRARLLHLAISGLSLWLVGCVTTASLPTGRISYASDVTRPDVPSLRGFLLAVDLPACETAVANMRAGYAKTTYHIAFAECRKAALEPGSEYWAVEVLSGVDRLVIGSSVQRYCEEAAKQQGIAQCSPASLRYLLQ
jgi:hypothetical protein